MNKNSLLLLALSAGNLSSVFADNEKKSISGEDIIQHANVWVSDHALSLKHDDLCILANLLYVNCEFLDLESRLRSMIYTSQNQLAAILVCKPEDFSKIIELNASALKGIWEALLPQRENARSVGVQIDNYLKSECSSELKTIIDGLEKYTQAIVSQLIRQDQQKIENKVQECNATLKGQAEKTKEYIGILDAVLEHKNPYLQEGQDAAITDFNVISSVADSLFASCKLMNDATTVMKYMSLDVMHINRFVFQIFYKTLYERLKKENMLPMPLMFNAQKGKLCMEECNVNLPALVETPKKS